jgi:MFS family permease
VALRKDELVLADSVQAYRKQWLTLPSWLLRGVRRMAVYLRLRYGSAGFRFLMLGFTVVTVMSGYFSYDLPGVTSEELKHEPLHLNNVQLGLLFSVYAFPNAFLPLLSGMFFTLLGVWRGVILIGIVISIGVFIVAVGVSFESFWLMLLGRLIYGLGGESMFVGVDVLATEWFKDAELGLAYGLVQAAGQLGSFAAFYGVPKLMSATHVSYSVSYYLAAAVSVAAIGLLFVGHALEQTSIAPALVVLGDELNAGSGPTLAELRSSKEQHLLKASLNPFLPDNQTCDEESDRRLVTCSWLQSPRAVKLGLHHFLTLRFDFFMVLVGITAYTGCFFTFLGGSIFFREKEERERERVGGVLVSVVTACFPRATCSIRKRLPARKVRHSCRGERQTAWSDFSDQLRCLSTRRAAARQIGRTPIRSPHRHGRSLHILYSFGLHLSAYSSVHSS